MKLSFSPTSPYVRKVRVCALELGLHEAIELETVTVSPVDANDNYARATNPLGKIPALTLDDGTVLYDSGVICQYLASLRPAANLIPGDATRWAVLTQHQLATGIKDALLLMRYEYWARPDDLRWVDWYRGQERKVHHALDWFENHLDVLQTPLNLAHIALGCALGYLEFRFPGLEWRPQHPRLTAWYKEFGQRPAMAATAHQ